MTVKRYDGVPDYLYLNLTSTDGSIYIAQTVEQGFIYDGDYMIRTLSDTQVTNAGPLSGPFENPFSFAFCPYLPPSTQASSIVFDPTLSILYNPPIENTPAPEISQKTKAQNRGALVASIVAPIIVVLLVASLILAYFLSPTLRNLVRPFRKRNHASTGQL